jgi:hypothetical protein
MSMISLLDNHGHVSKEGHAFAVLKIGSTPNLLKTNIGQLLPATHSEEKD